MNIFPRPAPRRQNPVPAQAYTGGVPRKAEDWERPWPRLDATFVALMGLLFTAFSLDSAGRLPSDLARTGAYGVGITLLVSFALEARSGLKNLVRADLMGIVALYYLTLYEFLFHQPYFDKQIPNAEPVQKGLWAIFVGFAGLFIGRHLLPRGKQPFEKVMTRDVPFKWLMTIYWGALFFGFFYMMLSVDFNVVTFVDYLMKPRFEQPWGRPRLGDWKALLHELELLLYLVPPVAGLMLARREKYPPVMVLLVLLGFLWTLFYGFLSGTRSLLGTFLVTFMIAYTFAAGAHRRKESILICVACASMMVFSTKAMLQMRTIGFKNWWEGRIPAIETRQSAAVFVDDNLLAISTITKYFPEQNNNHYLGFEIPYLAVIRPIPRELWRIMLPGEKPTGLSISIEKIFGVSGLTIAATFVGEGYMSGGFIAVLLMGITLGWLAAWWNRLASPKNSELGMLIYASGFFAVTITMRSLFALTTAVLPCVVGLVAGKYLLPAVKRGLSRQRGAVVPPKLRQPPPKP